MSGPTDFHPRAVALGLAKLLAEHNTTDAGLLIEGCTDDELPRLVRACGDLVYGCLQTLGAAVEHLVHVVHALEDAPEEDDDSIDHRGTCTAVALVLAELACSTVAAKAHLVDDVQDDAEVTNAVVFMFARALTHQLTEHPDGDEDDS